MDWSKGFSATYYMSIIDPVTWRDVDRIEIKGGEISRSESELVESADVDCVRYSQSSERYVRIWLNTKQGGGRSSHTALFTGLATSPNRDINGTLTTNKVQCYSVLKPAKDVLLQRGWYAPAGMSGAFIVKDLLSIIPAPVKIEGSAPNLAQAVIAENGESHLSMAWKVLNTINWRIRIEGDGTVVLCSQADSVSAIFDPLSNDVIEPQITVEYDWYGCPNVFRAVMDDISAVARDDDPDSPLSTVSRGREIWMEETDCDLNVGETISQYAHRRLKEEQSIAMKVSYDRRFIPSVRVGDLVGLRIPAHKITGTFIVESHTVEIGHGARTSEDVRRVSNENVMNVGSMFNSYNSSVSPVEASEAYAVFDSSDGSFTFFRDTPGKYTDGQVSGTKTYYTGFEDITGTATPSWCTSDRSSQKNTIRTVTFKDKIQPKTCYRWFIGADSLTSITRLYKLDTENATNISRMFQGCSGLTSLDLSSFNTAKVTDMGRMFQDCNALTNLDLSSFNTANVTNMDGMFYYCTSLTSLDLSSFNTAAVTNMNGMFENCNALTSLDVSSFDTENVKSMGYMFQSCSSLTSLDVSSFDTENVKSMGYMFINCTSLTSLDLSSFNTANVTNMGYMFRKCSKLKTIYASSLFTTDAVSSSTDMFYNNTSLVGGAGTKYNQNYTDKTYARIDGGTSNPGYFTAKVAPAEVDLQG